jgi:hypothetical protein
MTPRAEEAIVKFGRPDPESDYDCICRICGHDYGTHHGLSCLRPPKSIAGLRLPVEVTFIPAGFCGGHNPKLLLTTKGTTA